MPRFNENEKEILRAKLMEEGGKLFTLYGLKRVTVDELARSAGIAKGSFYAFFPGKEHLFMEIISDIQKKMWSELEDLLLALSGAAPKVLLKRVFMRMLEQTARCPLLQKMDAETTEYLFRKLPREAVEAHTRDDGQELLRLGEYGVRFNCDIPTAAKTLQTAAMSFFSLSGEDEAMREQVIGYIIDGVIDRIVSERND